MRAVICPEYGSPDILKIKELEKPTPKENEVLIKVHAASINATDAEVVRGNIFVRLGTRRPTFLGCDLAGQVEAIGSEVTLFKVGDEVYTNLSGLGYGAFVEYTCVPERLLRLKPASMTFEEASTIPEAAVLALQGLRAKKKIKPGDKVLINGAGGGVGTFAIQIAKYFGAEVTAVDNTEKLDMMLSIGADHVIDYTQEDFTKNRNQYDRILDVVGKRSIFAYKRALKPRGVFLMVGGTTGRIFQTIFVGSLISLFGSKKLGILIGRPNKKDDMDFIQQLFEAGEVKPIIDKCYPLDGIVEALQYLEDGHALGKLVITMV
ncbi:MAG: NAD(P)-dependent alcohol dehydrogenase [Candidatus Kariarchaeaceae archaeon]|jgi:NADPH:quinone reductase-like Zn-dependent oxidoreductase